MTIGVGFSQPVSQQTPPSELLLQPWGGPAGFTLFYRQSIDAFFAAEEAYRHANYQLATQILEGFWAEHPQGAEEWGRAVGEAPALARSKGVNFGTPVCYYALRMLTECVAWRLRDGSSLPHSDAIRLSVVLVGHSSGIQPTSMEELRAKSGLVVHHSLHSSFASGSGEIIDQSLFLFCEYVRAITDGRLRVDVKPVRLPDLDVPVEVTESTLRVAGADRHLLSAGLAPDALARIWQSLVDDVRYSTDWWWIVYPSHVPEQYPEFAHTEFVTGGMGIGPDGRSPAFIGDDLFFVRNPPHLGTGQLTDGERRAWFPQWFQHEFFHHLYRTYPRLQLETASHQWFDRRTWPDDFAGLFEPDYYAESLHKRLQSATPPLHVALRYALPGYPPPPKVLFQKITPAMLRGRYRSEPLSNSSFEGIIEWNAPPGTDPKKALRWTNGAGVSWPLLPDLKNGLLLTGNGGAFRIILRRGPDGEYIPEVSGFEFLGAFYAQLPASR